MLLQAILWVASLAALTFAILGSALVATRAAVHETIAAKTRLATNDAVAAMTLWVRAQVEEHGAGVDWMTLPANGRTFTEPLCANASTCTLSANATWAVTGDTDRVGTSTSLSAADNMASAINEQRVSATVQLYVRDGSGNTIATGTRKITLRILDAAPYAVVSGAKDVAEMTGSAVGSEGDTGGSPATASLNAWASVVPDEQHPAAFTDTRIKVTEDCANTVGVDEIHPAARANQATAILDGTPRSEGTLQWAYQLECTPSTLPDPPSNIQNYTPPEGSTYASAPGDSTVSWSKNDRDAAGFAP